MGIRMRSGNGRVALRQRLVIRVGVLLAAALLLYGIVPQVSGLQDNWHAIAGANKALLVSATSLLVLTFMIPAAAYQLLTLHSLRYGRTLVVQVAAGLAGKILPSGLGTIGLNIDYLRKCHHDLAEASTVVAANNVLGFAGYVGLVLVASPLLGQTFVASRLGHAAETVAVAGTVLIAAAGIGALFFARQLRQAVRVAIHGLQTYDRHPLRLAGAAALAVLLPCVFTAILYICALAIAVPLTISQAFAAFSAAQLASTVTPTPGGVVGAEAGITAALVAYGLPAENALTLALLYRFITYWLPMLPGGVALGFSRGRYL